MDRYKQLECLPLTIEEKERWTPMLHRTWQAIGSDVEQSMRMYGEKLTEEIIVEMVCDANRVQRFGGMTDAEYEFLCAIFHKRPVQRWLCEVLCEVLNY